MPRLPDPRFAPNCSIVVDGRRVAARAGESVTSALLAAGEPLVARSAKYHRPRGPFCLAASCASCLVRVDGTPNVRACETPCREGLRVDSQNVLGGAAHDLLGAIDRLAPNGIDHHHMGTWSRLASRITVRASRELAGLGELADAVPAPWPPSPEERVDALVVGGGPAGLGAAEALAKAGRAVVLCDRERTLGGRLRCRLALRGDPPLSWAYGVAEAVWRAGGEVLARATALGLWRDGGGALTAVALPDEPRLRLFRPREVILATGTWAQPPLFEGNDLPGIHGARGLAVALAEDGVVPGARAAVLGVGPEAEAVFRMGLEAEAIAERFEAAGMGVEVVEHVRSAIGRHRVAALRLQDGRRVLCDTVAVATPRMPAIELARAVGAPLALDKVTGAYLVRPGEGGAVAPGVRAAGEMCGPCSAAEAVEAGRLAGEAASRG
jgi:sarcosine oxidase subunit alpha